MCRNTGGAGCEETARVVVAVVVGDVVSVEVRVDVADVVAVVRSHPHAKKKRVVKAAPRWACQARP